jgi:hypothetical protein
MSVNIDNTNPNAIHAESSSSNVSSEGSNVSSVSSANELKKKTRKRTVKPVKMYQPSVFCYHFYSSDLDTSMWSPSFGVYATQDEARKHLAYAFSDFVYHKLSGPEFDEDDIDRACRNIATLRSFMKKTLGKDWDVGASINTVLKK